MIFILILWAMCRLEERLRQATGNVTTRTKVNAKIDAIADELTELRPATKLYSVVRVPHRSSHITTPTSPASFSGYSVSEKGKGSSRLVLLLNKGMLNRMKLLHNKDYCTVEQNTDYSSSRIFLMKTNKRTKTKTKRPKEKRNDRKKNETAKTKTKRPKEKRNGQNKNQTTKTKSKQPKQKLKDRNKNETTKTKTKRQKKKTK